MICRLPYSTIPDNSKGKRLLVDERYLRRYGLQDVAMRARKRMIPYDEGSFALLLDSQDPFAFENDLATYSYFGKKTVKEILPFAVSSTWQHTDRLVDLANYIEGFDLIHSFRLDPIVQVMSAWLWHYNDGIDGIMKSLRLHPALEPGIPYPKVTNPGPIGPPHERVQYVEQVIENNRNDRATELLRTSFSLGTNKNLLRLGLLKMPGVASSILYTFDRALAEKMMYDVISYGLDPSPSFRHGITGEAVVNAEDLADDVMFDIVFKMLFNGTRLTKVHVHHQGSLALTIDRRWLKRRIAGLRKLPGDLFALGERFIPLVKASLGQELGPVHPDVQLS